MQFQNPILKFVWTDGLTDGQAQSNVRLQLFHSWGHNRLYSNQLTKFEAASYKMFRDILLQFSMLKLTKDNN